MSESIEQLPVPHHRSTYVKCDHCGKLYPTWPHEVKAKEDGRKQGLYCSRECSAAARETWSTNTAYCDHCNKPFSTRPARVKDQMNGVHRRYCSRACKSAAQRAKASKSPWARFLLREVQKVGSITALSNLVGISKETLSRYIRDGVMPGEKNYRQLQAFYGDALPPVVVFTAARRQEAGRAGAALRCPFMADLRKKALEARRRKAEQMKDIPKGQKRPRDVIEKLKATNRTSQKVQARVEELARYNTTLTHRIQRALTTWLRYYPTPSADPTWAEKLEALKNRVANRHKLPEKAVAAIWNPILAGRGLKGKGGRRVEERRFVVLERLALDKGVSLVDEKKPRGFWVEAGRLFAEAESQKAPYPPQIPRNWWQYNKYRWHPKPS